MWFFNRKSKSDIIRERIVSHDRSDIFVQSPKGKDYLISMLDNQFAPEFATYCKQYYSKIIRDKVYYIQLSFMSAPHGLTRETDTNLEIIDYSVCWDNRVYGYIANPKNHLEYIPMRHVFPILCEILKETGRAYTINISTVKYNIHDWEQDNMLLTIAFVHQSKTMFTFEKM